jgi:hypothetical protein
LSIEFGGLTEENEPCEARDVNGEGKPPKSKGQDLRFPRSLQKKFFSSGKKANFYRRRKCLILLAETGLFSQRFIKEENRVNPTVGFRIRLSAQ